MSNRLFQNVIDQIKEVIERKIGVIDYTGLVVASSEGLFNKQQFESIIDQIQDVRGIRVSNGYTFNPIENKNRADYIVFVEGQDEIAKKYASLISISVANIKQYYDDKYDKGNFIRNIVLDNILPGDTVLKAKELHLSIDMPRVVLLIRSYENNNINVYDTLQNLFPSRNKDFIFIIDKNTVILVKELKEDNITEQLDSISRNIVDTLNTEILINAHVGIGTVVNSIQEIAGSYKDAQVALEIGKVFDNENYIISYDNLGIGRLIYQLPTTLCELFLAEVFKKKPIDALDDETMLTIKKFFENNLNVSESSRQLYVHRNTLVYRLDKIERLTGLDLRKFDDAIIFKVAMMVKKYLDANPLKI